MHHIAKPCIVVSPVTVIAIYYLFDIMPM